MRIMLMATCALLCTSPALGGQTVRASFYHESQRVACGGAKFNPHALTAASRVYRCGDVLRLTHANGRSVEVLINDFGPAVHTHRDLDISLGAAQVLHMVEQGVANLTVEKVK